jgi:hypothetical protein
LQHHPVLGETPDDQSIERWMQNFDSPISAMFAFLLLFSYRVIFLIPD